MLEYIGEYGTATVMLETFAGDFDAEQAQKTISQIYECLNHPAFTNPIVFMPDLHVGKGVLIGFTMFLTDKVIPNVIGVDIGCGMIYIILGKNPFDNITPDDLDSKIREAIPFGKNTHTDKSNLPKEFYKDSTILVHKFQQKFNKEFKTFYTSPTKIDENWIKEKCQEINMDYNRAVNSIGTLGGGNHFIEIGIGSDDIFGATVHSGSRQFGLKIANYHQRKAGKGDLAYLEGNDMFDYLIDMVVAQSYANYNRMAMASSLARIFNIPPTINMACVHNYIDFEDFIIRKGAISAYKHNHMIIPFNMEDGVLLCKGKSNKEWNYSAPHGSGRVNSRTWAKANLNLDEAKDRMSKKGIYCSSTPIDETKEAYKNPKLIEDAIEPTAEIIDRIRPVLVCKKGK